MTTTFKNRYLAEVGDDGLWYCMSETGNMTDVICWAGTERHIQFVTEALNQFARSSMIGDFVTGPSKPNPVKASTGKRATIKY